MSPRRGLTVNEIVNVAATIANQKGLQDLSISLIAQDLNIKSPSLYNHVNGLDEIHDLLAVQSCLTFYNKLKQATAELSKEEALRNLCYAYIDFAKTHPGQYEAASNPARKDNVALKEAQESVVEIVRSVLFKFGMQEELAIHLVRMLRSMLHGFVTLEAAQGFQMPYDIQDSLDIMIETFLKGIKES